MADVVYPIEGGCDCGRVRYRLKTSPMFTQCCHCYRCQRRTGSAFVINALIEEDRVESLGLQPEKRTCHAANFNHQHLFECPVCCVTLWSTYDSEGGFTRFVRVGTLDDPSKIKPDIHIYVSSKQPWVSIPDGVLSVPESYKHKEVWPKDKLERQEVINPLRDAHWDKWVIEARRLHQLAKEQEEQSR
jgi:hypothetical protein